MVIITTYFKFCCFSGEIDWVDSLLISKNLIIIKIVRSNMNIFVCQL